MNINPVRRTDEPEISLTSLIDVVFTLIIFFVVTTTFEDRAAMEVNLPEASADPRTAPADPLVVVVDQEGRYFVGGNEVLDPGTQPLRNAIERIAGDDRERPVIVRGDARTPYQAAITAMDVLGQLGFTRVSLATTPASGDAGGDG